MKVAMSATVRRSPATNGDLDLRMCLNQMMHTFRDRRGKEKTHKLLVQNMVEPSGLSRVPPSTVRYVFGRVTVEVSGLPHHGPIACDLP